MKEYINNSTSGDISAPSTIYELKADKLISFNYSRTAQKICELNNQDVAYVHGNIYSDIVVGIEQSMIGEQSFKEESNYIVFFKRFRRILKNCNKDYNSKIIKQLDSQSTIGIYGHSLDLSDVSLLKEIFLNKYKRYDIYCYKNTNDYKIKLVNLLGLDVYDELEKDSRITLIKVE